MLKHLHAVPSLPLAAALVGAALAVSMLLPTPVKAQDPALAQTVAVAMAEHLLPEVTRPVR